MFRTFYATVAIAAVALALIPAETAEAQPARVQVGTLNCSLSSSVGLVFGSARNVNCIFRSDNAPDEDYTGRLTRVGLDIGVTNGGVIVWAVFANTNRYAGMLTGRYVGATAEASIALGLGANALVGGSNTSVALQPLSVQSQVGLNIAAGVGELTLRPTR
jgi:Protein of unknown function (DUF992)